MQVTIIGGSIAGLEAAINLSKHCTVTLYEEHDEIGKPLRCAEGWFVHHGLKPYGHIVREIDRIVFRRIDLNFNIKEVLEFDVGGRLFTIDRPKMEKEMAKMAEEMGCVIFTGRRVKLNDCNGSDIIVDASGWPSQWDREFNKNKKRKKKGAVAVEAVAKYDIDYVVIDISRDFDGYFWIFPTKEGYANIGVGYWRKRLPNLKQHLFRYLDHLGAQPVRITGGVLGCIINKPFVRMYGKVPVCLVGDAAGLVDPFFAEGMTKAILSSRILAKNIISGTIHNYEKEYMKLMRHHYIISRIMYLAKRVIPHWALFRMMRLAIRFAGGG